MWKLSIKFFDILFPRCLLVTLQEVQGYHAQPVLHVLVKVIYFLFYLLHNYVFESFNLAYLIGFEFTTLTSKKGYLICFVESLGTFIKSNLVPL